MGVLITGLVSGYLAFIIGKWRHECIFWERNGQWNLPSAWHNPAIKLGSWLAVTTFSIVFSTAFMKIIIDEVNETLGLFSWGVLLYFRWMASSVAANYSAGIRLAQMDEGTDHAPNSKPQKKRKASAEPKSSNPHTPPSKERPKSSIPAVLLVIGFFIFLAVIANQQGDAPPVNTATTSIPKPPSASISQQPKSRDAAPEPAQEASRRHSGGRSAVTYDVQFMLKDMGYDPGKVDGIYATKTKSAIEAFQRDYGLQLDGRVSTKLRDSILEVREDQR